MSFSVVKSLVFTLKKCSLADSMEGTLKYVLDTWMVPSIHMYLFFNLGLVLASPADGGDTAAKGSNKVGKALNGIIDSVGNALTFGHLNDTSVGQLADGLGDMAQGALETTGTVANNTAHVSKSQKIFFLSSNTVKSRVITRLD